MWECDCVVGLKDVGMGQRGCISVCVRLGVWVGVYRYTRLRADSRVDSRASEMCRLSKKVGMFMKGGGEREGIETQGREE